MTGNVISVSSFTNKSLEISHIYLFVLLKADRRKLKTILLFHT